MKKPIQTKKEKHISNISTKVCLTLFTFFSTHIYSNKMMKVRWMMINMNILIWIEKNVLVHIVVKFLLFFLLLKLKTFKTNA